MLVLLLFGRYNFRLLDLFYKFGLKIYTMAKILFFYPNNPLKLNHGNNARANSLLQYFKIRGFEVDFVGIESDQYKPEELSALTQEGLASQAHLLPKRKNTGLRYLFNTSIKNKINKYPRDFQWIYDNQVRYFKKLLESKQYDYILISYIHGFPLIADKKLLKNTKTVVDTHDFFTSQYCDVNHPQLGRFFETELKLLEKFNDVWAISAEEQFVFSQFLTNKNILTIPHGIANKSEHQNSSPTIDICYVASNNEHNVKAASWFFNKVYPLLPPSINITVVGSIVDHIPNHKNVVSIKFVEDLDTIYSNTKVTVCPMLTGTGLKIKVVESLAYGLPVVCNTRGVDGLSSKINNGCLVHDVPSDFADAIIRLLQDAAFYAEQRKLALSFFNMSLEETRVYKLLDQYFNVS